MNLVLLSLALVQAQPPSFTPVVAIDQEYWLMDFHYPERAIIWEESAVTQADIFVGPDGLPQACYLTVSGGAKDFDGQTCAAAMTRGKFKPATDESGKPMNGMYRFNVVWRMSGSRDPKPRSDVVLTVGKLPTEAESVRVELAYRVDENGRITKCQVHESSGFASFDAAACRAMPQRYTFAPARDKDGKAWPVIRTQTVAFELSK